MKEYTDKTDMQSGQVKEPLVGYASPAVHATERAAGISSALMDELLHQSNDVKLLIIQKLSESMMTPPKEDESRKEKLAARRKEIEAKLDELHRMRIISLPATRRILDSPISPYSNPVSFCCDDFLIVNK